MQLYMEEKCCCLFVFAMVTLAPPCFKGPKGGSLVLDDFFPFFVASRHWLIPSGALEGYTQS